MFEELGVPVFYSDEAARGLMDHNPFIMMYVKKYFGDDIYPNGKLDRKKLAEIVFNDKEKLDRLNKIVHPWVGEAFSGFCFEYGNWSYKYPDVHYVIEEAAIAIELGIQDNFDHIIVVTADEDVRVKRTMSRDNCSEEKVRERMNNQLSDEEKIKHADFVIVNNDFPNLECQVKAIHKKILDIIKK
jgi:dephospho-CoA kinase